MPTTAFSSDSFSQQIGDEFIWEMTHKDASISFWLENVGDQLKAVINDTYENLGSDCLFIVFYKNTASNRTWVPIIAAEYATYDGETFSSWDLCLIIPHNATAVQIDLNGIIGPYEHFLWSNGPNGYDGEATAWDGSSLGDLGAYKLETKFNADGIAEYISNYNGTGTSWNLRFQLELVITSGIPSFFIFLVLPILGIFIVISHLVSRKNQKALI